MPSWGLLCCSLVAVLGTLLVTAHSPDLVPLEIAGLFALAAYVLYGREPPRFRAALLVALAAAALNAAFHHPRQPAALESRTARYRALLLERQAESDGGSALTLALENGTTVTARVRGDAPAPGTRIIVRGRLAGFDDPRNPGEPSERELENDRGNDAHLDAATIVATLGTAENPRTLLARAHEWAHDRLRARLGEPAASVLAGELWGERSALPPQLRAEFQETGTVHVLVTAGLHLGAVATLCTLLLAYAALPRWTSCLLTAAFVWGFVWWSGGQLPAERAATMLTAALAARALGRAAFSWNVLAVAAMVVTLLRPQSAGGASFALSFSCVGAIFAWAAPIERWLEAHVALPARVREGLTLTLATQLGTWPLGAAIFLQFATYAPAANLAVVPCVAASMALGALQLAMEWCAPLATLCANLNAYLLSWMLGAVQTLGELPDAAVAMTPAPAWCIALYDAALLATPLLWKPGPAAGVGWAKTSLLGALLVSTALVLWPPRALETRMRIVVLDVGQADAIAIETPRGHTLLVDAGGRLERFGQGDDSVAERVGERIVVPFLLRQGIHTVDAIVLSHPHGDHAGGAAPVLRRLRVAAFADGGQRYNGHAYRDAVATAAARSVPIVIARTGMVWQTDDGLTLRFIGPSLPFITGGNAINSNSVAFLLQYGRFRMLFTGDAGSESEQRFLREGADLHADVLKVGHHGSAYGSSPQFLAAVHPRYAVISVGRHNLFGHPAPSTLDALEHAGTKVYRTDENGAVTIATDGNSIAISTMLP